MKRLKYLIGILLIAATTASAAPITVKATMDSTTLLIGEQRKIHLEVEQPKIISVIFPDFQKNNILGGGIEVLRSSGKDTSGLKGGVIRVKEDLIVTAFDTGRYEIPPFKFETHEPGYSSEYPTERIIVDVVTIEEDFSKATIKGSHDIIRPGFNFKRAFQYFSFLLILAGIVFIVIVSIIFFSKKKKQDILSFDTVDRRTPQEVAMSNLMDIKEEKVWEKGQQKKYYTQITDTLRNYFVERFNIGAMEMTTKQIIDELRTDDDAKNVEDKISQVFQLSDMVKFAKYQPTKEENEMSIVNAMFIVQQTAQFAEKELETSSTPQGEANDGDKPFTLS